MLERKSAGYFTKRSNNSSFDQVGISSDDNKCRAELHDQVLCWLRLIRDRRWSRSQKLQILKTFGNPESVYQADKSQLRLAFTGRAQSKNSGISEQALRDDVDWLCGAGNALITFTDPDYPALLREIDDPPIALFAIGDRSLLLSPGIAIVGSRRPTPVGTKLAEKLSADLARLGIVVTSGMALGVDGVAHTAALGVGGGTISVMGCGLDTIYPARHRNLYKKITSQGLVVSEYPLGVPPSKYTFPERNRIVSGLSYGVIIVEAAQRSGTLITARLAAEQNREVMVVPGSALSKQYEGSHQLLKQGAALIVSVDDVLQNLSLVLRESLAMPAEAKNTKCVDSDVGVDKKRVLECIGSESTSTDSIIMSSGLTAAEVSSMLLILELDGLIAIVDDGGYINLS